MRGVSFLRCSLAAVSAAALVACGGGGGGDAAGLKEFGGGPQVDVYKFYDANRNGRLDAGEEFIDGWKVDTSASATTKFTHAWFVNDDGVTAGALTVREFRPGGATGGTWVATNAYVAGDFKINPVSSDGTYLNKLTIEVPTAGRVDVKFGNVCMGGTSAGGRTPGYWSNRNGAASIEAAGSVDIYAGLSALHLVQANGSAFDPADHDQLSAWLRGGNAQNMAHQLSRQLAAAWLNVHAGDVVGGALVDATGYGIPGVTGSITVNQLLALAEAALAAAPVTTSGHPQRAAQEALKNLLDDLNNNGVSGGGVLPASACTFSF
ncbi:hypothetical protein JI739_20265 [Ramlibacter sp. AW1]|uniref:EF-hand domain-containing protein n=1 Tax=Ramlibacter aurantiacus TaxID=2801330 RepID=A0A936ZS81_9BURK|nr:hypothetical protein [Ramlibacter aurantiacus]MBL0422680.1 hypothetical protein [Ramlibacter aurantiacus]